MDDEYVAKYAAFFEYMGLSVSKGLTAAKLDAIQEEGMHSWFARTTQATEKQLVAFHAKKSEWWEGDRFILYPEIHQREIHSYLTYGLPEILAKFVRSQFQGNTQQITMVKIKEVAKTMLEENPTWWHSRNRKQIFLERFKLAYPLSCDGNKPSRSPKTYISSKNEDSNEKTITINVVPIVIGIVVILILYNIFF